MMGKSFGLLWELIGMPSEWIFRYFEELGLRVDIVLYVFPENTCWHVYFLQKDAFLIFLFFYNLAELV